jgi:hypothetical protein
MPIIWIGFSTDSAPPVHKLRGKPGALKKLVAGVVKKADPKASLIELYFEVEHERACALVLNLDDYVAVRAVKDFLEADEVTKFITTDQAIQANRRRRALAPKPRPRRKRT